MDAEAGADFTDYLFRLLVRLSMRTSTPYTDLRKIPIQEVLQVVAEVLKADEEQEEIRKNQQNNG